MWLEDKPQDNGLNFLKEIKPNRGKHAEVVKHHYHFKRFWIWETYTEDKIYHRSTGHKNTYKYV